MPVDITENCNYTNKYQVPVTDDDGDEFGGTIEDFMKIMAAHTHDGDTSNYINLNIDKDMSVFLVSVPAEISWIADQYDDTYTILQAAQGSTRDSNNFRKFYIGDAASNIWEEFNPRIVWESSTQYRLYSNINDKDIKVFTI